MFGSKKRKVVVTLGEATQATFDQLDSDVQALVGLVDELVATHTQILQTLKEDIEVLVADNGPVGFEAEPDVMPTEIETPEHQEQRVYSRRGKMPSPPDSMMQTTVVNATDPSDPNRIRNTPFTRAPRSEQVAWLMKVMEDHAWHTSVEIATEIANDPRHLRYLKHALGGRLREMHEDGLVERRTSSVKGAMFEYRLLSSTTPPHERVT